MVECEVNTPIMPSLLATLPSCRPNNMLSDARAILREWKPSVEKPSNLESVAEFCINLTIAKAYRLEGNFSLAYDAIKSAQPNKVSFKRKKSNILRMFRISGTLATQIRAGLKIPSLICEGVLAFLLGPARILGDLTVLRLAKTKCYFRSLRHFCLAIDVTECCTSAPCQKPFQVQRSRLTYVLKFGVMGYCGCIMEKSIQIVARRRKPMLEARPA